MVDYKSNIWKLYLYKVLVSVIFIGGFWVPFYQTIGDVSFFQIMVLETVFVIGLFLFEIPTGAIADHFGRKTSIILSAFFNILAVALYALFPRFWVFFIGNILWAVSISLYSGSAEALFYDTLKAEKIAKHSKHLMGKFLSFEYVGYLIAGPIGGYLAASYGLRATMELSVIPFVFSLLVSFLLKEPPRKKKLSKTYLSTVIHGTQYFRKHPILKILAFDNISIAAIGYSVFWMYQPLLLSKGVPLFYMGLYYSAICGIPVLFLWNLEKIEKFFGSKKRYLFFSAFISSGSILLMGFIDSLWILSILLLAYFGFGSSRHGLFASYLQKHIPSDIRATVTSTMSMLMALANGVVMLIVGVLVEWSLLSTFVILGAFGVLFSFISKVQEEHLLD